MSNNLKICVTEVYLTLQINRNTNNFYFVCLIIISDFLYIFNFDCNTLVNGPMKK